MNLSELKIGQEAKILSIKGVGALRHRLLEMGIIPDTNIKLVKVAPLGDPLEIKIRGYDLSIRKDDAKLIEIEVR